MSFSRLVRFVPRSDSKAILLGEPVDQDLDVGVATRKGEEVKVRVFDSKSALQAGSLSDRVESIERLLSPLTQKEVGTIRCIGLNYKQHAAEVNMKLPTEPTLFLKPETALADPYPAPTIVPRFTLADDCADYESELAIVLAKPCKDVSEADAASYILGYTACNDVSSRKTQLSSSQWCFSKGFDGSCPIGPTLVSPRLIPDPSKLKIVGSRNGDVKQECGLDDMIFSVSKLISFLSQGTTLPAGTVIITGTPAGVGLAKKEYLKDGDEFSVAIQPHIGTLTTVYTFEKDNSGGSKHNL